MINNHEFGTAFLVDSKFNDMVKNFTPINERLCVIRIKGRFFNYSLINIFAPTIDSDVKAKDEFYEQLERAYTACPNHDMKLVMGDANAKVGRETVHQPTIGKHSLLRVQMKMASDWSTVPQAGKWRSKVRTSCTSESTSKPCTPRWTHLQPDVIEVMARRGANIDSDHMLVVIKLRARICRANNTKPQQLRRFAVNRLKNRDVASRYYDTLESELQGVQAQPLSSTG
jgi:hypothetical protein